MAKAKRATSPSPPAGRKDDGTQIKRLRRLCLSIPGTTEKLSHGEPTLFTPKRVFAMFANNHHDDDIAVWLPMGPGVQAALIDVGRADGGIRSRAAGLRIQAIEALRADAQGNRRMIRRPP